MATVAPLPSLALLAAGAVALAVLVRRQRAAVMMPPPPTMRAVVARDGRLVVQHEWPTPVAAEGEVLIRVMATGINRLDTVQRKGLAKPPAGVTEVLGLECAGEVVVSRDSRFLLGDRVMALLPGGGYAEYVSVSAQTVLPMPSHMTWAEGASVAEAWLTAYQLVVLVAGVKRGEAVLIHAAASGVGLAAIQIVVALGAIPVVTVGSKDKLDVCVEYGAAGGAIRHDGDWITKVAALSPTKCFQVVLDPVAGAYAAQNLEALAVDGRWVLYSSLSGSAMGDELSKTFLKALMVKRISLLATTLRARPLEYKADLVRRFARDVLPQLGRPNGMRLAIDWHIQGLERAQAAHDYMESNANIGKIVLGVGADGEDA